MPQAYTTDLNRSPDPSRHRALVQSILDFWRVQDVEQTLSGLSEGILYQLYTFHNARPSLQLLTGKDAVRTMMFEVLAQFDYLHYEPTVLDVSGGIGRVQIQFDLRHRASGERLTGSKRQFYVIGDHVITRINEFHDTALVAAFLRLTQSTGESVRFRL